MKDLLEKIIKSPLMPEYYNRLKTIVESEQEKRRSFRDKITENDKAEFINGEVIMHSPAKYKHILITGFLHNILSNYINKFDLGVLLVEKAMVSLGRNDYEPDLCFFGKTKANKFTNNTMIFPAPDLVVEILSESTKKRDRGIKFEDYALNKIPEYWIIDPESETIEQYILWHENYELFNKAKDGLITVKQIQGLELPVRAIFDTTENQDFLKKVIS